MLMLIQCNLLVLLLLHCDRIKENEPASLKAVTPWRHLLNNITVKAMLDYYRLTTKFDSKNYISSYQSGSDKSQDFNVTCVVMGLMNPPHLQNVSHFTQTST